ncbi:MAG: hypothetical protein HYS21_07885 [Deltaproteobacteria bacterium]|nr:hypothetical protein [Deltaproteobacteria bacterium]
MKTILILILIYIGYRYLRKSISFKAVNIKAESKADARQAAPPDADSEEMVLDPVCKSYIPISSSVSSSVSGRVEYFCGPECRDKFISR